MTSSQTIIYSQAISQTTANVYSVQSVNKKGGGGSGKGARVSTLLSQLQDFAEGPPEEKKFEIFPQHMYGPNDQCDLGIITSQLCWDGPLPAWTLAARIPLNGRDGSRHPSHEAPANPPPLSPPPLCHSVRSGGGGGV